MTERRKFFVSYSRVDAPAVERLAAHLRDFGQEAWLDEELSGGQRWWDAILEQIRACNCVVFAQSRASCLSVACRRELEYAVALGKPVLPVLVGDPLPPELLPPFLAETHRVDARNPSEAVSRLARALFNLPPPPPLPDPLPPPPPVPVSYMTQLTSRVETDELSLRDQRDLLGDLRLALSEDGEAEAARELLKRLRARPDLFASVASEIDAMARQPVAAGGPAPGGPAPGPAPPPPSAVAADRPRPPPAEAPPARPVPRRSRWGRFLAITGAVALVLVGLGIAGSLVGDPDVTEPTIPPATVPMEEGTSGGRPSDLGASDLEVLDRYFRDRFTRCQAGGTAEWPNCGIVLNAAAQYDWLLRHGYVSCRNQGSSPSDCVTRLPSF